MGKTWPETELVSFRWRDDTEDETSSGTDWLEILNANTTITVGTGSAIEVRLRFLVRENNGASESVAANLYVSKNGGSYTTLAASDITYFDSTNLTDGDDTTQQLGSGTYVSNNNWVTEDGVGTALSLNSNEAEIEYTLSFPDDLVDSDYYDFQVYDSTSAMDVVSNTARATISNTNINISAGHVDLYWTDHTLSPWIHRGILEDPTQDYFHRFCTQATGVTLIFGSGGWNVSDVTCTADVTASSDLQYTIDGTWEAEQYAETWVGSVISGDEDLVRIGVRVTDGTTDWTGYILEFNEGSSPANVYLYRYDDGTKTELDSANAFTSTGEDHLSIKVEGTTITTYKNFVAQHSVTDSNYSSGSPSYGIKEATGGSSAFIKYIQAEAKAGDTPTNIDATLESFTLTEYNATVDFDVYFTATLDTFTLTEYNVDVNPEIDLDTTLESFTLTEYNSTVDFDVYFTTTLEALTLTEYNATVDLGVTLNATLDTFTLTAYNATVDHDVYFTTTLEQLTLTEFNADVNPEIDLDTTLESLTLTDYNATVDFDTYFTTTLDSLTLTAYNCTVQAGEDVDVNADVDALTLTDYNTVVDFDTYFTTTLEQLTLTDYNATVELTNDVNLSANVIELTLTPFDVTVVGETEAESSGTAGGYYKRTYTIKDADYYEKRVKELLKEEEDEREDLKELKEELVEKETVVLIDEDPELESLKTQREIIATHAAVVEINSQIIQSQQELARIQSEIAEAKRLQAILQDDEEFLAHYIMVS